MIQKTYGSWGLWHIFTRFVIGWTSSIRETPNIHRLRYIPRVIHGNDLMTRPVTAILRREDHDSFSSLLPALPVSILRRKAAFFMGLNDSQVRGHFLYTFRGFWCTALYAGPVAYGQERLRVSLLILLILSFTFWFLTSLLSSLNLSSKQQA